MGASEFEQQLALTNNVTILHWMAPVGLREHDGAISVELARTELDKGGRLKLTDETQTLEADVVFKAIGQKLLPDGLEGVQLENGRIVVDASQATSLDKVWAGGDCVAGGEDLTVSAVQHGKIAAHAIDRSFSHG